VGLPRRAYIIGGLALFRKRASAHSCLEQWKEKATKRRSDKEQAEKTRSSKKGSRKNLLNSNKMPSEKHALLQTEVGEITGEGRKRVRRKVWRRGKVITVGKKAKIRRF